jgi:hypothetical protein
MAFQVRQYWCGTKKIPKVYADCMAKVKAFYGDRYTLVRLPAADKPQDVWELAAFEDCSKNPDLLVVSCDCVTEWEPSISGRSPAFSFDGRFADTGMFYVNNCCGHFRQWHADMLATGPLYGLARKIVRRSGLSVDKIPTTLYNHLGITLSENTRKKAQKNGTTNS